MYQYKHMISPIFYTIWQNVFPPHSRDRCTYILCQVWLNRRQYVVFHSELSWNRWSKLSATAAEVGHLSVDPRDVRVINESSLPQILHYHQPYFPIGFPANFSKNWSSIYGVLTDYLDSLITVEMPTFCIDHHINTCRLSRINFINGVSSTSLNLLILSKG